MKSLQVIYMVVLIVAVTAVMGGVPTTQIIPEWGKIHNEYIDTVVRKRNDQREDTDDTKAEPSKLKDHSQDIKDIKDVIDGLFMMAGKDEFYSMEVYKKFFTDDLRASVDGKTTKGLEEFSKLGDELHSRNLSSHILEYGIDPVVVNGNTGDALVSGVREIDGEEKKFSDIYNMVKIDGKWKIEGMTVIIDGVKMEEED